MAVTRAPRPASKQIELKADQEQLKIIRNMMYRASKIYVWTIEKHQSKYFTDVKHLEIYVNRYYAKDTLEWFPRDLFLNVMRRARMHYLSNPDRIPKKVDGRCLTFQFKDFKTRSTGIDFTLLEEVPHLNKTWIPALHTHEELKLTEAQTTGWLNLRYSKKNHSVYVVGERFRHLGLRSDVVAKGKMWYGSIEITDKEIELLKLTADVIGPVRKLIINSMFDHKEATGKYPNWNTVKRELSFVRNQLDKTLLKNYSKGISASYYHTAMQALHKFHTEGDAKFWFKALDRVSMLIDKPSAKLGNNELHLPKIGAKPFMAYHAKLFQNIGETVKIPHVVCLYLNRSKSDTARGIIRFGVYPTDPNRFNDVI